MTRTHLLNGSVLILFFGLVIGCSSDDSETETTSDCVMPIGLRLTLGTQQNCELGLSDLRDFRVYIDPTSDTWTAERLVGDTYEYLDGRINRFDQGACRTTANVTFSRAYRGQDNTTLNVELNYDIQITPTEVYGLAQTRVICDPSGNCGASFVGDECLFTANVDGEVYCRGEECQPLGPTSPVADGGMSTSDGGARSDAGIDTDMGTSSAVACPEANRIRDHFGIDWVCIEGGDFEMGNPQGAAREQPVHTVSVATFWMMQTEATVAHYRACTDCARPQSSSNFDANLEDHPVNGLTRNELTALMTWLTEETGDTYRLPSESEWEFAARSRGTTDTPWTTDSPTCDDVHSSDCGTETAAVCSAPGGHTTQGLCDMLGNVAEVLEDDYHATYDCNQNFDAQGCDVADPLIAPTDGSAWVDPSPRGNRRVKRGRSFRFAPNQMSTTGRDSADTSVMGAQDLGFRFVRDAAPQGTNISCGNARTDTNESCDDGNRVDGDGCDAQCNIEQDYRCTGEPSVCAMMMASNAPCANTDQGCPDLGFVSIEGGRFQMGLEGNYVALPIHSVNVPSFEMMRTEVTVAQYRVCVDAGVCQVPTDELPHLQGTYSSGLENHPVNYVSWDDAKVFANFVDARLPSEAEWEYAARSQGQDFIYPWGANEPDCTRANFNECIGTTTQTCAYPDGNTIQGLCDMAGNVWEWTEDDLHGDYLGAPNDGSAWIGNPRRTFRAIRGGSFKANSDIRVAYRGGNGNGVPASRRDNLGFRLARSPNQ
jgi:cysteine-rich repeat protein